MSRRRWQLALVIAVAVQCYALYWPRPPSVDTGLPLDKVVHLGLFAGVALLGLLAGVPKGWLVGALVLQAVASEAVQAAMPTRSADGWDLAMDLAGIALGVWAGLLLQRRGRPRGGPPRATAAGERSPG